MGKTVMVLIVNHIKVLTDLLRDLANVNHGSTPRKAFEVCKQFGFVFCPDKNKYDVNDLSLLDYLQYMYGGARWRHKGEVQFNIVRHFVSKLLVGCLTLFANDFRSVLVENDGKSFTL